MSGAHFEVYRSRVFDVRRLRRVDEWRWRLRAGNGEIVASGEGYLRKDWAVAGVAAVVDAVADATGGPDAARLEEVDR